MGLDIGLITAVLLYGRQGKEAKGDRRETATKATAANDHGDAWHGTGRRARPAAAAAAAAAGATAAAARSGVSSCRLHLSNVSSSLSVNSSSVGLARLRRSNSIVRVAAEKKAKKVLYMLTVD